MRLAIVAISVLQSIDAEIIVFGVVAVDAGKHVGQLRKHGLGSRRDWMHVCVGNKLRQLTGGKLPEQYRRVDYAEAFADVEEPSPLGPASEFPSSSEISSSLIALSLRAALNSRCTVAADSEPMAATSSSMNNRRP